MRRLAALGMGLLVLAAVTAAASAGGDKEGKAGDRKEDKPENLNRLLVQRHEVLRKTLNVLEAHYKAGTTDFGRVEQAQRELLKAGLELPQSREKRVAALREARDLAETMLRVTETRFKAGTTTQVDVLQAEAALLEARIALLREQAKARPGK
jgi:outer membrane protein TolC